MEKLNEVKQALKYLEVDARAYADNFSASMIVSTKNILAIAEAFRALEQRAEAAEAKLAELANNSLIDHLEKCSAIVASWPEWKKQGADASKFTRAAPAAGLVELVPDEITHADAPELQEIASSARAIGIKGAYAGFAVGANWMRAAILRNIEEAK